MITQPTMTDLPQLTNLWKACFHDEEELIAQFFHTIFRAEYSCVWKATDTIAAALYGLPCDHGRGIYLYALGTLEAYRHQGLMSALLTHALQQNPSCYHLLIPANKGLVQFYERFGFVVRKQPLFTGSFHSDQIEFEEVSKECLISLIASDWPHTNVTVSFDKAVMSFVLNEEAEDAKTSLYRLHRNGHSEGYAVCQMQDGQQKWLHYGMSSTAFACLTLSAADSRILMVHGLAPEISGGFLPY